MTVLPSQNPATGSAADGAQTFIRSHTKAEPVPLVPEISVHQALEITPIWSATETFLNIQGIGPPFWAFPWVGGQALARYLLDNPERVRGRSVLDFGSGNGIVAIAAAMAGARAVVANDIDPMALTAIEMNAALNGVTLGLDGGDRLGPDPLNAEPAPEDVIVAGDVCYEAGPSERLGLWLRRQAGSGRTVLLGDPGRRYLPGAGLVELAAYRVPTPLELEDSDHKTGRVFAVTIGG